MCTFQHGNCIGCGSEAVNCGVKTGLTVTAMCYSKDRILTNASLFPGSFNRTDEAASLVGNADI